MQNSNENNQKHAPDSPSKRKATTQPKVSTLFFGSHSLKISTTLFQNSEFQNVLSCLKNIHVNEISNNVQKEKTISFTLIKEKSELREKHQFLEEKNLNLEKEMDNLKTKNNDFVRENDLLLRKQKKLENELSKTKDIAKRTTEKYDTLLANKEKDQELINQLQIEKADLAQELEETKNKLAYETNHKLSQPAHDPEKEKLIKQVSMLQKEKESLEQEYTQNISDLQLSAESKLRAKLSEVQMLQKQLDLANTSAASLAIQFQKANKSLASLQEQNKQLKTQIGKHIAYSTQSKETLEKISMQNQELMNENSNLAREKEALEKQQKAVEEKLTTEFQNLHSKLISVKTQNEMLNYHLTLAKEDARNAAGTNKKRKNTSRDITTKPPKKTKKIAKDVSDTEAESHIDIDDKFNKNQTATNRYSIFNESSNQQPYSSTLFKKT